MKKITRDTNNSQIGGVCAGFGNYFNLDPLWFRLLFVIGFFLPYPAVLTYIIMWLIIPEN